MSQSLKDLNNPNLYEDVCDFIFQNKEKIIKENKSYYNNLPSESSIDNDYDLQQLYIDRMYTEDVIGTTEKAHAPEDIKKMKLYNLATLAREQNYSKESVVTLMEYLALSAANNHPEKAMEIDVANTNFNIPNLSDQNKKNAFKLYNRYVYETNKKHTLVYNIEKVEKVMDTMSSVSASLNTPELNKTFFDRNKEVYHEINLELENDYSKRMINNSYRLQNKAMRNMVLGYVKAEGADKSYMGESLAEIRAKEGIESGYKIDQIMRANKIEDKNLKLLAKPNYKYLGIKPLQAFQKSLKQR